MAERGPEAKEQVSETDQLENLRNDVTCPECRKPFTQPKLLPCLHCACASCLPEREGVRDKEGLKYIVACPKCKQEFELTKTGVTGLPTAFFKARLSGVYVQLEKLEGKKGGNCEECSKFTLSAYCSNCEHFICKHCEDLHQQMKVLSTHKIISLEECKRNLLKQLTNPTRRSSTDSLVCQQHGEALKIYCKTCRRLICKDCTVVNHALPRHNWEFSETLVSSQKAELQRHIQMVRKMQTSVETNISEGKSVIEKVYGQRESMCETIATSFDTLVARLEECKQQVLKNASRTVDSKLGQLSDQVQQLTLKADELKHLVKVCEQNIEHTADQEFLSLKWYVMSRVKEVTAKKEQEAINCPSMFLPSSFSQEIMDICSSHLQLHHSVSLSKTIVSGSGAKRAQVGTAAHFTVHTVSSTGRPCLEKQNITVEICLPRSGGSLSLTVTPGVELGTYIVSYLPETRGQYKASVMIDQEEIGCSPFYITVRPSRLEWNGPVRVFSNQEWPWGVACTSSQEVYVTRSYQHKVAILDKDGHQIRAMGMKGQKVGHLLSPTGIAVDEEGNMYVADGQENGRVQKLNKNFQVLAVFAQLSSPQGVLLSRDGDKVYICDQSHQRIVVLDRNLKLMSSFGKLSQETQAVASLITPHSVAEDRQGNVYATDLENGCIQVFSSEGIYQRKIVNPHSEVFTPTGICIEEDMIFVSDCGENRLVVFSTDGKFVTSFGGFGKQVGQFYTPQSVAMDADGYLYVCDYVNNRVQVF